MGSGLKHRFVFRRVPLAIAALMLSPLAIGLPSAVIASSAICGGSTFAAGLDYSGAAISNGQLFAWGRNFEGQLGLGYIGGQIASPTQVTSSTGLSAASNVWAGIYTTFAEDPSGQLWGWGDDRFAERGNFTGVSSPQPVVGPTHVVSLSAGFDHTLAATSDGTLWGWGSNTSNQLGFHGGNVLGEEVQPIVLPGPANVAKVAAGDAYSLVLTSGGIVYGTGLNFMGQLGLGSGIFEQQTFAPIPGLVGIVDIAAGDFNGSPFAVAVDGNGHVFAFGSDTFGQMGNGSSSNTPQFSPVQVAGLDSVVAVSAGVGTVLALKSDHTVWAWGRNESGELGNGTFVNSSTPVEVVFPASVLLQQVAAGWNNSMALDAAGGLWVWGSDLEGQLGNGIQGPAQSKPSQLSLGPISAACVAPPTTYLPSVNGYSFSNSAPFGGSFNVPSYDQMAAYYPLSHNKIYQASGGHTRVGDLFYKDLFNPTYTDGLCYGMSTSDTFLFNRASPAPGTYALWNGLSSPFLGDTLTPPITTGDATIEQFIDRYHARQLAALGAEESIRVWLSIGHNTGPGTTYDRTFGNLGAFDSIAAQVKNGPEVVAFGPSPYILTGGPLFVPNPVPGLPPIGIPLADPTRFYNLYNSSHAVVAFDAFKKVDGTRVIRVYDPSSAVSSTGTNVIDDSRIEMAPDGSVKLIDFGGGGDGNGNPAVWLGGGGKSGNPGDWILMPLPDIAFSDDGIVNGADNHHWFLSDQAATAINKGAAILSLLSGAPSFFRFSGAASGMIAETLPAAAAYDDTITAMELNALTAVTIDGHLVTATQTDAGAVSSSHHILVDPAATSIRLDAATQSEIFTLEIAGDYLPAYSRDISMPGLNLGPGQTLSVSSDVQTSTLNLLASTSTSMLIATTFAQTGANPGQATVNVIVPAASIPATVSVFDWNNLGTSLIYEVIDAQGNPTGQVLQANAGELLEQVATDLAGLQAEIATISDDGLRTSLQAKLASAQDSFARGESAAARNTLQAMRNEIAAEAGKKLDAATATALRRLSADAIVLLAAG